MIGSDCDAAPAAIVSVGATELVTEQMTLLRRRLGDIPVPDRFRPARSCHLLEGAGSSPISILVNELPNREYDWRIMAASYDPAFYDIVHATAFRDDTVWYRARAGEAAGSVLELGAGTGRITIPIAQDGRSICALDADPGMLDALRLKLAALPADVQQRVAVTEGDMRSFSLDRRFALVIAPFRAFLHNLTTDDQRACLRRVVDHLEPGGRFAFNVFHPSLEYMARNTGPLAGVWRWRGTYPLPDGGYLVGSDATHYDTVRRRVHSIHRYDRCDADGHVTRTFVHRLELAYLYPADIQRLLQDAGFAVVEIFGDFHGKPFNHDTDELVIVARL